MRLYFPVRGQTGWLVVYQHNTGDLVPVLDCNSFQVAHDKAREMTLAAFKQAVTA